MKSISLEEYDQLIACKKRLDLFEKANSSLPNPLYFDQCAEQGCQAIEINDGGRGIEIQDGCESMTSCDFQSIQCKQDKYCDKHINRFLKLVSDGCDDILCCEDCWRTGEPSKDGRELK